MTRKTGKQSTETAFRTQATIIAAGQRIFGQKGFDGASLRDIAEEAGVAHAMIRHHFGGKDGLWRAVIDAHVLSIAERHAPLFAELGTTEPIALLQRFIGSFIEFSANAPDATRILMHESTTPSARLDYLIEKFAPLHRAIDPIFAAAQAAGALKHFTTDNFLMFLIAFGSFPFAINAFNRRMLSIDLQTDCGREAHVNLVMNTVFGTQQLRSET
jgi:AcrR family transcriptional regulator